MAGGGSGLSISAPAGPGPPLEPAGVGSWPESPIVCFPKAPLLRLPRPPSFGCPSLPLKQNYALSLGPRTHRAAMPDRLPSRSEQKAELPPAHPPSGPVRTGPPPGRSFGTAEVPSPPPSVLKGPAVLGDGQSVGGPAVPSETKSFRCQAGSWAHAWQ